MWQQQHGYSYEKDINIQKAEFGYGYGAPAAGYGYAAPAAPVAPGYGAPAAPAAPAGRGFALIVVLFILLVIIGAAYVR